jgi:hypothetical protein
MFFWLMLFLSVVSGILAHSDHEGFMSFVTVSQPPARRKETWTMLIMI